MPDEDYMIQLSSSDRTITIYDDGGIENEYHSTAYPIDVPLSDEEGEIPKEKFRELEFEKLDKLLEDVEENRSPLSILNPVTWLSEDYEIKKGEESYKWTGKVPEELEEVVDEIESLANEYASEPTRYQ